MKSKLQWFPSGIVSKVVASYIRSRDHIGKIRLIKLIERMLSIGLKMESEGGAIMFVQPSEYIGSKILECGGYEKETLKRCNKILKEGDNFIDVGANRGLYLCYLSKNNPKKCIAIEPYPENFAWLTKNAEVNEIDTDNIYEVAVSNKYGKIYMENKKPNNSGTARVIERGDKRGLEVESVKLEKIIKDNELEDIKLIKIDVEGYEMEVLRSIDWSKSPLPDNIISEFTGYTSRVDGSGKKEMVSFMKEKGYEALNINGEPISETNDLVEDNAWFRKKK